KRALEHMHAQTQQWLLTKWAGKATNLLSKSYTIRSVKDFDVYDAIEACADLLEQFGGHKYAAGLTLKLENIEAFQQRFEEVVNASIQDHQLIPEIEIDAAIELKEITPKFFRILKQFSPFGPGNMAPVFLTEKVMDKGYVRIVGNNHLKLDIHPVYDSYGSFSSIAFGQADHFDDILRKKPFKVCYTIEENNYNGNSSLQLNIKDLKLE
ncbi:MAG TPA: DHHA1 domain-containing protein, partial [Bacteroidia bacterium]|nr:DHHA1 domain-containing protein [Bacteroidia bacterium]